VGLSAETRMLQLIGEIQGILDLAELREEMLGALQRAVPSDWASLNDIGADPADTVAIVRPPLPRSWHELFAGLAHENPLLRRWQQTRDGRAYRFSDVAAWKALQELALFRQFYIPLGLRHQIAFTLPSPPNRILAIALSRTNRDFTDTERDFLNTARPFLIQAYRNCLAVRTIADPTATSGSGMLALLTGEGMTRRQAQILLHIARGRSNRDIAKHLEISDRTVQKHLEHAFRRLGVRTRSEAADRVWGLVGG
jgi:DNA-binding CsgD family transcriptional regulator